MSETGSEGRLSAVCRRPDHCGIPLHLPVYEHRRHLEHPGMPAEIRSEQAGSRVDPITLRHLLDAVAGDPSREHATYFLCRDEKSRRGDGCSYYELRGLDITILRYCSAGSLRCPRKWPSSARSTVRRQLLIAEGLGALGVLCGCSGAKILSDVLIE